MAGSTFVILLATVCSFASAEQWTIVDELDFELASRPRPAMSLSFGPDARLFQSGMVLSADGAKIWGQAASGANVTLTATLVGSSGGNAHAIVVSSVANSTGAWALVLDVAASSDAYALHFASPSAATVQLTNVLFGDVYLCGGQAGV